MFQNATRICSVGKKGCTILLTGNSHAYGVLGHSNRGVSDQSVKTESWDVKHLVTSQVYKACFWINPTLIAVAPISVKQFSVWSPVYRHFVWQKWIKRQHSSGTVPNNLSVSISP